jgi:hypothetical protein
MASRRRVRQALAMACVVLQGMGALAWAAEGDPAPPPADPVLVGAGGIASCDTAGDEATAALIAKLPDATVFTAGDNAYEKGTATQFAKCYDKTWGKFKNRTHPAPGNHDYATSSATPYYNYFGAAAGTKGDGWYSYDLGAWHIVVLNSNCKHNSRCAAGSEQEKWLKADLAASTARCTAAVIHHPRFSSDNIEGEGDGPHVAPLWKDLYDAGADLVVSGHSRVYERFAPQTPAGVADPDFGLPLINVGTGGRGHAGFIKTPKANSVMRDDTSWGVLKLTLHSDSFDYAFLPIAGSKFTDAGTGVCHDKPEGGSEEPGGGDPGGGEPGGGSEPPTERSFEADADAYVAKTSPKTNYGSKPTLLTDGDPINGSYLRFTVSGLEGTVNSARLRLWGTNGSGNGPTVYPTAIPWSESAVTWNTRPARTGPVLDDLGSVKAGQFVDLDVSGVVDGNGTFSFELAAGSTDGADFASSEASTAGQRPQLILDVTPPPPPEPPVTEPPPATEEAG